MLRTYICLSSVFVLSVLLLLLSTKLLTRRLLRKLMTCYIMDRLLRKRNAGGEASPQNINGNNKQAMPWENAAINIHPFMSGNHIQGYLCMLESVYNYLSSKSMSILPSFFFCIPFRTFFLDYFEEKKLVLSSNIQG